MPKSPAAGGYPLTLELAGRPCLVVGGGAVAARKVDGLLAAGATVTVVAPRVGPGVAAKAESGVLTWIGREFRGQDVAGTVLVFAATDDPRANAGVVRAARDRGVWVNRADRPEDGDFQVPAIGRKAGVTVAVSTGGASPALAAWLRDRILAELPPALDLLLLLARRLRARFPRGEVGATGFRRLFDSGVEVDLGARDWVSADRKVAREFGQEGLVPGILEDDGKGEP